MKALGKSPRRSRRLHAVGFLALALLLGGLAARASIVDSGGEFTPPLDDTYIYLQYARGAADGTPFAYQPGAAPTRGATSLLYPWLLAPWTRVLPPDAVPWAAWGAGVLFLALSATAAAAFVRRRAGEGAGLAAGLFTLLSGAFVWGTASGMDVGIYALAIMGSLAALAAYLDADDPGGGLRRLGALAAWLLVLGLARPEGIAVAGVIALAAPLAARAPNSRRARLALLLVPATAAALTAGANLVATGTLSSNSLEAKAVWSELRPDVRAAVVSRLLWVFGRITLALFSDFFSPAWRHGTAIALRALLIGGGALGLLAALRPRARTPERALVAALFVGLLAGLIPAGFNSHHHRYQIPLVPAVAALVALGLWRLPRAALRAGAAAALLALLLPGTARMIDLYGRNAANIHDQQVAAGRWIARNLPADARVAINDAGAIAYYGERPVIDLVGLVTNGSAVPDRAGPASLFEWLEDLPPSRRPTHFAIFPDWFPYLKKTSLVGRKLTSFYLADNTISGADLKGIYVADFSHTGADRPVVRAPLIDDWGFRISDRLDVADLASMAAHGYAAFPTWRQTLREFPVAGFPDRVLIDGGLQPTGGERFRLACRPGVPAALVMRTEAFRSFDLEVRINGRDAGTWRIEAASGTWTEPVFQIPGELLNDEGAALELSLPEGAPPYPVFHYWLLQ